MAKFASFRRRVAVTFLAATTVACATTVASSSDPASAPAAAPAADAAVSGAGRLTRAAFNQGAAMLALPLFWSADANSNGVLDPGELSVYWGLRHTTREDWVRGEQFTGDFGKAYDAIVKHQLEAPAASAPAVASGANSDGPRAADDAEAKRQAALRREIEQGAFTLLETDLRGAAPWEKRMVAHVMAAAEIVERLYKRQLGSFGMEAQIPADDTLSRLVFFLNQNPFCSAPQTQADEACTALLKRPERRSGLYPAALQSDAAFCEKIAQSPNAAALLDPFTVVVEDDGGNLQAVAYATIYRDDMQAISAELGAAAAAVEDPREAAFKQYLEAAAQAFLDNDWLRADVAWANMTVQNSSWYLRVQPDETYFEPCSRKAGFHLSFARINRASLAWQDKLDPLKQQMEAALAAEAAEAAEAAGSGAVAYHERDVNFHLPDFIDIILNAGDSRGPRGATVGQSLPNWGPVADEGRGRTVVMTNLDDDADSKRRFREASSTVICPDTMRGFVDESAPTVMSTILHEAAHNLGPAHAYAVGGKTDVEIFGGPMASMLEELKAQTAALFFGIWLANRGVIDARLAEEAFVREMGWVLGHISRGLYTSDGLPRPYAQLAAIQLGFFLDEGALAWQQDARAANGEDVGCLAVVPNKVVAAVQKLNRKVLAIKAGGDEPQALALQQRYVEDKQRPEWNAVVAAITQRWQRFPRPSFLYAVRM